MRGKLRDKRTTSKREAFKRELISKRPANKRDNRPATWLEQLEDEDYDIELDEEEMKAETPNKK
ncbi:MAG TPA: hypothetical protein VEL31_00260 [Ktedonobacteraceae bacterium]|nr:hypothetical protein [Ktedonobacteraceae bacterium]